MGLFSRKLAPSEHPDTVEKLRVIGEKQLENRTAIEGLTETIATFAESIEQLNNEIKETRLAVSEGIERVDRSERRIKATVARARSELESRGYKDPGLDAEAFELRDIDGNGSDESGLPAVPETVVESASQISSIRGVATEQLRRVRGL